MFFRPLNLEVGDGSTLDSTLKKKKLKKLKNPKPIYRLLFHCLLLSWLLGFI